MTNVPFDSVAIAAVHALWSGLVDTAAFALVVYVANAVVRPSAATRHTVWWLVISLAVAIPIASFSTSLGRVRTISRPPAAAPMMTIATGRSIDSSLAANVAKPRLDIVVSATIVCGALLGMWLAVALYKNVEIAVELFALARVKRRAKSLDPVTARALRELRANSCARRNAAISVSEDVNVPCAAGLWSPSILLPAHIVATVPASDIDRIAMHEYAHLWRFDDWTNLAERIARAVMWFNPAVALATRRIAIDREIACDDWVVQRTGGAHGYASCLFRLAAAEGVARVPAQALGALGDPKSLTARIEHLLSATGAPRRAARALPLSLSMCAVVLAVGQAMRAPAIAVESPAPTPIASAAPMETTAPVETASPAQTAGPRSTSTPSATATASSQRRVYVMKTIVLHRAGAAKGRSKHVKPRTIFLVRIDTATEPRSAATQVAPLPPLPPLPPIDSERIDAAAERLGRDAAATAERALERANRSMSVEERRAQRATERADADRFRIEQRDLSTQIEARVMDELRLQMQDVRRESEAGIEDAATSREQIRAALDIVKQTQRMRKDALEHALRDLR